MGIFVLFWLEWDFHEGPTALSHPSKAKKKKGLAVNKSSEPGTPFDLFPIGTFVKKRAL